MHSRSFQKLLSLLLHGSELSKEHVIVSSEEHCMCGFSNITAGQAYSATNLAETWFPPEEREAAVAR